MTDPSPFSTSPFGPDLWEVLARFLAGESPAGESEAVRHWLAQDPRRAQAIGLLERSFSALAFVPPADINVEAALAQAAVPSRLFGARVPPRALADAIARTGPAVVVLWSQMPETGDPAQLVRVTTAPHPPLLLAAAGPGWPAALPPTVARLTSLAEAVQAVRAAT